MYLWRARTYCLRVGVEVVPATDLENLTYSQCAVGIPTKGELVGVPTFVPLGPIPETVRHPAPSQGVSVLDLPGAGHLLLGLLPLPLLLARAHGQPVMEQAEKFVE